MDGRPQVGLGWFIESTLYRRGGNQLTMVMMVVGGGCVVTWWNSRPLPTIGKLRGGCFFSQEPLWVILVREPRKSWMSFSLSTKFEFLRRVHSLRVGWRNMCELPWFFSRIISFMLFTVLLSHMCFFEEFLIHNSLILKNNWPNLLGLRHFPLNT